MDRPTMLEARWVHDPGSVTGLRREWVLTGCDPASSSSLRPESEALHGRSPAFREVMATPEAALIAGTGRAFAT